MSWTWTTACLLVRTTERLTTKWKSLRPEAKLSIDFLGINTSKERSDGTIHLTQLHLNDQILEDLYMSNNDMKNTIHAGCLTYGTHQTPGVTKI
jgi:hypothetical protein